MFGKKKCTQEAEGTIVRLRDMGIDSPTVMYVQYQVNGVTYQIKEGIKLKSSVKKIGFLPIGQIKTPVLPDTRVGTKLVVLYNPQKPSKAYLRDNVGKVNC